MISTATAGAFGAAIPEPLDVPRASRGIRNLHVRIITKQTGLGHHNPQGGDGMVAGGAAHAAPHLHWNERRLCAGQPAAR
jgi:hypothetical protein